MKSILGSGLFALLTIVGMTLLAQNLSWSASISCDNHVYTDVICTGTTGDDVIKDGNTSRIIDGLSGNDNINSGAGDDDVCGSGGNDKINLGPGDDRGIADGPLCKGNSGTDGADTINGGPGNDILTHAGAWYIYSDGFKDILDCGPGIDLALLNITVDHDEAKNCEFINDENAPVP